MEELTTLPKITEKLSKKNQQKYYEYNKIRSLNSIRTFGSIISKVIPDFARDIVDLEKLKSKFCKKLKSAKIYGLDLFNHFSEKDIIEPKLAYKVESHSLDEITVASVDGSSITRNFSGFDISLLRGIGVIYKFGKKDKPNITYYPDKSGIENYKFNRILRNMPEHEISTQVSIDRAFMEINLVNKIISDFKKKRSYENNSGKCNHIDMFILDGSILTEPLNLIYSQNKTLLDKYLLLITEYKKLYSLCDRENILLVGSVKDTRSSTFIKLLLRRLPQIVRKFPEIEDITMFNYRKLMKYFSDLDLFHRILDIGERSCSFSISSPRNSWLPRQLELLKHKYTIKDNFLNDYEFFASYLKPVRWDLPMRLEFCINRKKFSSNAIHEKIQKINSIIMPLSSKLEDFCIPIPQIEAHMRAKLSKNDLKILLGFLERNISEEIINCSKERGFDNPNIIQNLGIDEFLLKNRLMVLKRREKLPL